MVTLDKYVFSCKNNPKCDPQNWWQWLIGWYRYHLYYSKFSFLIRKHIREQITWRIEVMDRECYTSGQCKKCGCATTALQMANRACKKPCYPDMMSKKKWKYYKTYYQLNF